MIFKWISRHICLKYTFILSDIALTTVMSAASSPFISSASSGSESSDEKARIDKLQEELINVQVWWNKIFLYAILHNFLVL